MDFYTKDNYTLEDIQSLITNGVEESLYLDYKRAFGDKDKARFDITKDVSSFANSDGGIIVYGVEERNQKPQKITPINGYDFTKEWIESIIQSIRPRIEDIKIFPIRVEGIEKSIYVVQIPSSEEMPHMAKDNKYYKRCNFESTPMEEYEVKNRYFKTSIPKLKIEACSFACIKETKERYEYQLVARIVNVGKELCSEYKLNFYLNNYLCDFNQSLVNPNYSLTAIHEDRLKISVPCKEAIYPGETLNIGFITIYIDKKNASEFFERLIIDMILFYQGGEYELAYVPYTDEYIEDRAEISQILQEMSNE